MNDKMKDSLMKKRQDFLIFTFDLLAVFFTYSMFIRKHFSIDSYMVYYNMDPDNQIRQTRLVNYVLIKLFEVIGFNTCKYQSILTGIFIVVAAFSVLFLTKIFLKYAEKLTLVKIITVNLAILIFVINIYILEWFLYPESMLFYAISLFFAVFAVGIIDLNGKFFVRYFVATIFLLISLNCYQASMPIYVIYGVTLLWVKNKFTLTQKAFFESFCVIFSAGFSSVCILIEQRIAANFGAIFQSDRGAKFSLEIIINNINTVFNESKRIFSGYNFLPKYIIPLFIICVFTIIIYAFIKDRSRFNQYLYLVLVINTNFFIVLLPHIITKIVWFAPRTIVGMGAFLSTIVIIAIYKSKSDIIYKISAIISALFILFNYVQIQDVGINHFANNVLENEYSVLIQDEINEYEKKTGNKITSIASVNDENPQYNYRGVKYTIFDTNVKAFIAKWGTPYLIGYYNDRNYNMTDMNEKVYNDNFKGKDWEKFEPEEQLVFIENTLYICIY